MRIHGLPQVVGKSVCEVDQIVLPSTSLFAAGHLEMIQAATSTPTVVAMTSCERRCFEGR
ncbi:hypothetical protein WS86_24520 [Burkholderia savannae]|nr:hypothetical protein WS86_24520 [Burkholderia savannae]